MSAEPSCDEGLRPLAEVLIDFASPFFPLAWRNGPSTSVQTIMDFAAAVWNAVNEGATAESLIASAADLPESEQVEQITEALVKRKQLLFAGDRRMMPSTAIA